MATTVKTFAFATTAESFTATQVGDSTLSYDDTTGNPSGCLVSIINGRNKGDDANYWDRTLTWEDMGVPSGNTVTGVTSASMQYSCTGYDTGDPSTHGAVTLVDGATTITLSAAAGFSSTTSWLTSNGVDSTGLSLASSNSVTITINNTLNTGNDSAALVELKQDQLVFTITYEAAGTVNPGVAAFTGGSSFASIGDRIVGGAASFTGGSSLSATGSTNTAGTASFAGSSSFAAIGSQIKPGVASFSGGSSFSAASGIVIRAGLAPFTGSSSFSASGATQRAGTAAFTGSGSLVAIGAHVPAGGATVYMPNPMSEFLRDPNLLIPWKKPVGRVKIDRVNPISRGCEGFLVNGLDLGVGRVSLSGGATLPKGNFSTEGTSTGLIELSRNISPKSLPFVVNVRFKLINGGVFNRIFCSDYDSYYGFQLQVGPTNKLELAIGDGTGTANEDRRLISGTTTLTAGWHKATIRWDSYSEATVLLNDAEESFTWGGSATVYAYGNGNGAIGRVRYSGTDYFEDTEVEHVSVFTGYKPDGALWSLHRDPYQVLVSA